MRPPNGILGPKDAITTTVVKFVEQPKNPQKKKKTKDKFKIVSFKVREGVEFTLELELEKLKKHITEVEAHNKAHKKPVDDKVAKPPGPIEGVLDEWVRIFFF